MVKKKKFILDACCGPKAMWLRKNHPNVLYIDKRSDQICHPDLVMDFRDLKFEDESFYLVVFDPPHIKRLKPLGTITKRFGVLHPETWQGDIKKAFKECFRVLKPYGTLMFKWSDCDIKVENILHLFPCDPLFFNRFDKKSGTITYWFCFMKIPGENAKM